MGTPVSVPAALRKSYRTCKSCVGTDLCRFGLGDSMALAGQIEARVKGIDSPAKLKLATTGCPRNFSEAPIKDVGMVATGDGKWEIYVGGAGGSHVRKGDLLCTVDSHEKVLLLAGRFMQFYREEAKFRERTYTFIERVGIERVRAVVIADSEDSAERLDAAMQQSIDTYVDPWQEAARPKTANEFASLVPAGE